MVDGHKRHEDSSHSDEEVAILMEAPSRRSGPFMRFQDCTSPVERFTTSRLVAEMLKKAGQVRPGCFSPLLTPALYGMLFQEGWLALSSSGHTWIGLEQNPPT